MTREERELSIEYLEGIKDNYIEGYGYERHPLPEYYAIENAIKALEQLPKLQNRCYVLTQGQMCSFCSYECRAKENFVPQESEGQGMKAVNVDDVLKILHKYGTYIFVTDEKRYSSMEYEIANLKPLKQEPKTGHWVHGEYCSECGCDVPAYIIDWKWQKDMDAKFCPNCGAKMVEPQESEG